MEVSFDKSGQLRVLEEEKYEEAKRLNQQCTEFVEKTERFSGILSNFLELVEKKARLIESEKMRAIGLRNQVESEKEIRKRKLKELNALIAEKQAELDRYYLQHQSLLKVQQEQKILIDKLSNNEL